MRLHSTLFFSALCLGLAACGCSERPTSSPAPPAAKTEDNPADVPANLAKLSADDRQLAARQQFCAVEPDHLLGSMGVPIKVMVKHQPVFLCCSACRTKALAHADRTLARVKQLQAKSEGGAK
jgi:hypothetical protein